MATNEPLVPKDIPAAKTLAHVLDQSERIKDVVEECAEDLAAVNSALKNELENRPSQPGVEKALQKSESVESKVQDAAEDLTNVNRALEAEVKERHLLEHELTAVKKQEEAARHAAFHDPLTSLPNRVLFNDRLEHGLAQAKRHDWTLAVMFIDLDNFKSINDTHGHVVGDAVLQAISLRLKNMTRDDDTVCRHGGDEFLYLLLELKQESDATMVAEKIILAVGEPCEINAKDGPLMLSVKPSIGIAIFPTAGETVDALIQSADRAMYQAKRNKTGYAYAE
jgi:diguanylate cyclase (GGDEF)-like protein